MVSCVQCCRTEEKESRKVPLDMPIRIGGLCGLGVTSGQCGNQIAGVEEYTRDEQGEFTNGLVGIHRQIRYLLSLSEEQRKCHLSY